MDTCKSCGACPTCGRHYNYGYYHYPYWNYPNYYPYQYWSPIITTSGTQVINTAPTDSTAWNYGHTTNFTLNSSVIPQGW